jgi:hypothetical protein
MARPKTRTSYPGFRSSSARHLYEGLEDDGRFQLVRLSHEPVREAQAIPVHHEVKSFESQLRSNQEVTESTAILDDPLTAFHIETAALGLQIVSGRRPLVLVGDRAFQMTGPEISHAREHWCNPIIVLFNNSRWEMLQAFFHEARYHSTVPWPFAALAERWGGRGLEVRTPRQLRARHSPQRGAPIALLSSTLNSSVVMTLRGFVQRSKSKPLFRSAPALLDATFYNLTDAGSGREVRRA